MGKLKNLTIVFDGNVDVFSPGDVIRGQVILLIEADTERGLDNIKGIWLRFIGGARIACQSGNAGTKDEGYFDTTQILFGTGPDTTDVRSLNIAPGQQVFPFAIRLPDKLLPVAFEEQLGCVRYQVKATLSLIRSLRNYKEYRTEKYFSVIGPAVDLNTISGLKMPMTCDVTTRGWFGLGPPVATLSLTMPKQGYVPGESVNLTGRIDNRKGDDQFSIRVKLIQEIQFSFPTSPIYVERVLAKIDSKVICPKGRISNFTIGPLRIPPVPSSGLPGCDLINIEYFILCKDRKFTLTIGTVPLRNAGTSRRRVPRTTDRTRTPSAPPEELDDDAPPSYEQVVSVTDRIAYEMTKEDFQSEGEFLPRYTYFARMGDFAFASHR
ncbi:arrestin domain-containing protein 1-like isoform X1 [Patiria miniata]|uniref:Arrestin C-terminal-like domain-containing protein n=1 Tax=Patiria miniata TaxID=46514 RepID=A0A914AVP1_PATMI|nr:arrestin domain-containing protein 1-like isoform X1 [Patiria miniata]